MRSLSIAIVLMLVTACGGKTDENAASGGAGGTKATGGSGGVTPVGGSGGVTPVGGSGGVTPVGGSGGVMPTGGTGGVPNECSVFTSEPAPYTVTFRFTNPITQPLFIRQDCMINWSLYSCADGFTTSLAHDADCMSDCADPTNGCIACGACLMQGIPVTQTAPYETKWAGFTYTFGTNQSGCSCFNTATASAGKYEVRIPVYQTKEDAEAGKVSYEASAYFDLPAPNGIVIVPLVLLD